MIETHEDLIWLEQFYVPPEVIFHKKESGNVWFIFVSGDSEEIVRRYFWSFLNLGATTGEITFLERGFDGNFTGYFLVRPRKFKRALFAIESMKLALAADKEGVSTRNKRNKEFSAKFCAQIKINAGRRLAEIQKTKHQPFNNYGNYEEYAVSSQENERA